MKKNLLQIISLCLTAVLLAVCVFQGFQLREYKELLDWELEDLRNELTDEINGVSYRVEAVLEEDKRIVEDCSIEPMGVNMEAWSLETDVSVALKEWNEDTEVTLITEVEGETLTQPMSRDNSGNFAVNLSLPLDKLDYPTFYVQIQSQGRTSKEELDLWVHYTQLLPLSGQGGGWTGPYYEDGVVSSDFYINLQGSAQTGEPPKVSAPEFRIYKNGELVQTLEGVFSYSLSIDDIIAFKAKVAGDEWRMECQEGDTFVIRFCCQDEYGLGYDFFFMSGAVENGRLTDALHLNEPELRLFRPEK